MHTGSCLCGEIQYRYHGDVSELSMCHCVQCQKGQGSAFAAVVPINDAQFEFTQGEQWLTLYRSSENKVRAFCRLCGSPIYSARDDLPGVKRLRVGTLDTPLVVNDTYHIFVSSKVDWYEFDDSHPKYERYKT